MKKLFNLFVIFCLTNTGYSQKANPCTFSSFQKDYKHLMALQPTENYKVGVTTEFYKDRSQTISDQTQKAELKVLDRDQYVFNGGANLQIQEASVRIDIDTVRKRILVSKANKFADLMSSAPALENMDSTNFLVTKSVTGQKVVYEVVEQNMDSQYQTIRFSFDASNNRFLEMELILWPKNYANEELNDESFESPRIVYSYSAFTTIDKSALSKEERLSDWCSVESNAVVSKKQDYKIYDLR